MMQGWAITCLGLSPIAWLLAAFAAHALRDGPAPRLLRTTQGTALSGLIAVAAAAVCFLLARVPGTTAGVLADPLGPLARIDAVTLTMGLLVNFIGTVVLAYSRAYLGGDVRQALFLRDVSLTVAAVSTLVLAGNTWLLFCAWVCMSLALHRLLLFRRERRGARVAAAKKFFVARLGDACLGLALLSLSVSAGSADIAVINAFAQAMPAGSLAGPALLLVAAAALKSAQFPTHGWLTEVMEAPTPVSALLHAGVVNAGGFLLVRFAGVVGASPAALYLLVVVGGVTALFGSLVMLTQRSVKVSLAYSTIAQMGFMLLQCGLGAFSSAMLHIVAHSLYKAHAFLSSSSIVDLARGSGAQGSAAPLRLILVPVSLLLAAAVFFAWSAMLGITLANKPAIVGLGSVLLLGVVHLVVQSTRGMPSPLVFLRVAGTAAVVSGLYFTLQALAAVVYEGLVPAAGPLDTVQWILMAIVLAGFALATGLQWALPRLQRSRRGRALWVHLSNGLYVNQLSDQVMQAYRVESRSRT